MSLYYPQAAVTLRIRWEDYGINDAKLQEYYKLRVLAKSVEVEINDYTEADTFKVELDYKSFPFDPRTIRMCGVTIHMEDMENLLNIIEPTKENTIFIGFADEDKIKLDEGANTVTLEGRDQTSLLIDSNYLGAPIPLSQPLDKIIEQLLQAQEATKAIIVDNRTGEELPKFSELGSDLDPNTAVFNPKNKQTYWDIIQNLISRAGLICYIDLDKLVISKPQKIYNRKNAKHFIFGYNIKTLEMQRKLGRNKGFNVKVQSIDFKKKTVVTAKIPLEATDKNIAGPEVTIPQIDKDGKPIDPPKAANYLTFNVADISDKDALIKIGENIFEELSRQQIEGKIETREMLIPELDGENTRGRVTRTKPVKFSSIRVGTPILVTLNNDDLEDIRTISSVEQRNKFLRARGFEPLVAQAFAESMNRFDTLFYTKSVRYNLDDNGFTMNIDFINFIEINAGTK